MDLTTGSLGVRAAVRLGGGASKGGGRPRLGSREERREVYARFLGASVSAAGLAEHGQFQYARYPWRMSSRAIDKLEDLRRAVTVELLQSYADLRLVANPEPLAAGEKVMRELDLLLGSLGKRKRDRARYDAALDRLGGAQREFTEVCRADLWYLPRWWQLWRPALWGRWWRAAFRLKRPQLGPTRAARPGQGSAQSGAV